VLQIVWSALQPNRRLGDLFVSWSDLPGTLPKGDYESILGTHYFGDLLDGLFHVDKFPSGSYFGLGYIFFWLLRGFDYRTVFLLYLTLVIILCIVSLKLWLSKVEAVDKAMVYALHFAYPFVFALDRGQLHLIFSYLLGIGLSFAVAPRRMSRDWNTGLVAMASAFSIKIYSVPIYLAFDKFYLPKKSKYLIVVLLCLSSLSLAAMTLVDDFTINFQLMEIFFLEMFESTLKYNVSLGALMYQIYPQAFSPSAYSGAYFFYLIISIVLLKSKNIEFFERLLAITILTNSISPISGIYVQTTVCMVALVALSLKSVVALWRWRLYWSVVFVSIIPLNVPLVKDFQGIREFRFQNAVVPVVQHGYVTALLVLSFATTFKRFPIIANRVA
jgi:hypothetical protein